MKAPRTNTGVNVLKDREHLKQGSPNLNRRVSMLGNIIDVKYPGEQSSSSGIQVLIRFEDGQSPVHWFTLAEDYALCITVMGNRDAVKALQPRCIYTYHPTSFFSGIAKLTTDRTQEQTFVDFLKNLSNAAVGFFGGLLGGVGSPPGTDVPPFNPVAPASPAKPVASNNGGQVPAPTSGSAPLGPQQTPSATPAQEFAAALADPKRKAEIDAIYAKGLPWLHTSSDGVISVTTLDNKNIVVPVKYLTTENVDKWIADPPTRGKYTEVTPAAVPAATPSTSTPGTDEPAPILVGKKVLLIGSSSAQGIASKLSAQLFKLGIKEFRGIGESGSNISQWSDSSHKWGKKLESNLASFKPDVVIIFLGTNDERGLSEGPGRMTSAKASAIQQLKTKLAGYRSLYIGLPPHTMWKEVPEFRAALASAWGADYLNIESLNPPKAQDGYHLNQKGYDQVVAAFKPWVQAK